MARLEAPVMNTRRRAPAARASSTDRKSTRLNSSHSQISYAVFCLKKKKELDLPDLVDRPEPADVADDAAAGARAPARAALLRSADGAPVRPVPCLRQPRAYPKTD